ncbi:MAG: ABC transporter permease subunit [Terracidiphilus sp.]
MPMSLRRFMCGLSKHTARVLLVLLIGGFLGATLVRLSPGFGVDTEELDSRLSNASIQALRQAHASHRTLAGFYIYYMSQLARGNLGVSETFHEPVRQLLAERFPDTLKTVGIGLAVGWTAGLTLALVAVMSRAGFAGLLASLAASLLLCIPAAVMALLFVIAQAPGRLVVGLIVFPKIFHYSRNLLERSAALPHVLTARAKGAGSLRVLLWHILPVAAPQLLALAGVSVSLAFAAAIPVEVLCDLPGIGQLAWRAAMGRDLVLLVDLTMIVTLVTLLANTAADLTAQPMGAGER